MNKVELLSTPSSSELYDVRMFWIEFQYLFCGLVFSGKRFDLFDHDVVSVPSHFFI